MKWLMILIVWGAGPSYAQDVFFDDAENNQFQHEPPPEIVKKADGRNKKKKKSSEVFVGGGALIYGLDTGAVTETGEKKKLNTILVQISLSLRWRLWKQLHAEPYFLLTPLGLSTMDDAATVRFLNFAFPVAWNFKYVEPRVGLGLMFYLVSGSGGTVTLNNGNTTEEFFLPGRTTISRLLYLEYSVAFRIGEKIRLEAGVWHSGFLSAKRSVSIISHLSYRI